MGAAITGRTNRTASTYEEGNNDAAKETSPVEVVTNLSAGHDSTPPKDNTANASVGSRHQSKHDTESALSSWHVSDSDNASVATGKSANARSKASDHSRSKASGDVRSKASGDVRSKASGDVRSKTSGDARSKGSERGQNISTGTAQGSSGDMRVEDCDFDGETKEEVPLYGLPKLDLTSKQMAPKLLQSHITMMTRQLANPDKDDRATRRKHGTGDDTHGDTQQYPDDYGDVSLGIPWRQRIPNYVFLDSNAPTERINDNGNERGLELQGCEQWKQENANAQTYYAKCADALDDQIRSGTFRYADEVAPRLGKRNRNKPVTPKCDTQPPPLTPTRWVEVQYGPDESQWWREDCVWAAVRLAKGTDHNVVLHWHGGESNVVSLSVLDLLRAMIPRNPDADLSRKRCPLGYVGALRKNLEMVPQRTAITRSCTSTSLPSAPDALYPPNMPRHEADTVATEIRSRASMDDDAASLVSVDENDTY